jgi:hypothetical protein
VTPVATIVIPTHDHWSTLDLAIASASAQDVQDVEILVVGDGVDDSTRGVALAAAGRDERVRFLDLPKGPHHGEVHRGRAVREARAPVVTYLSDDDLLTPDHVRHVVQLLEDAELVQPLNGWITIDGAFVPYPGDLADPACRRWLLRPDRNSVSLTGTAHTTAAYLALPSGWRTTPRGRWPDHFMWEAFLRQPWVRARTGTEVTALQFPGHHETRRGWSPDQRRVELASWAERLQAPGWREEIDRLARRGLQTWAAQAVVVQDSLSEHLRRVARRRMTRSNGGDARAAR